MLAWLAKGSEKVMEEPKIITRLHGGLGNQMFQYSLGRALSLLHHAPLYLDISVYRSYSTRQYALDVFNIAASALPTPGPFVTKLPLFRAAGRVMGNIARQLPPGVVAMISGMAAKGSKVKIPDAIAADPDHLRRESEQFAFDSTVLASHPPIFLVGFWQNEKYFSAFRETIQRDFTLRAPLSATARAYAKAVAQQPSASLHIRRGDYVHSSACKRLNVCGLDYYGRALRLLVSRAPDVCLFVFSDEIEWAKAHLKFDRTVFIEGCKDYEEMFLMSRCTHNIIANSSFSWWGAWLNANAQKIVVAPGQWVNADIGGRTPVPDTWEKV